MAPRHRPADKAPEKHGLGVESVIRRIEARLRGACPEVRDRAGPVCNRGGTRMIKERR